MAWVGACLGASRGGVLRVSVFGSAISGALAAGGATGAGRGVGGAASAARALSGVMPVLRGTGRAPEAHRHRDGLGVRSSGGLATIQISTIGSTTSVQQDGHPHPRPEAASRLRALDEDRCDGVHR